MTTKSLDLHLPAFPGSLAEQFQIDKGVVFLNHGSFGACPLPVFEAYQTWQRELERQPIDFIGRRVRGLLESARGELAAYMGTDAEKLVFVPNATFGVNAVARSLDLQPGDEVLGTDHEYGAVNNVWEFNCGKHGARYVRQPIPLPLENPDEFVEQLWEGVTPNTKVIAISHITSPTALIFPVTAVCQRARAEGIVTVIDGAHALGQIDLNLEEIGASYYTGNAHKWLCAPKGSAFLYAAEDRESVLEPLVVSHGWSTVSGGSRLQNYYAWMGTMDPSAYLSVPAAIRFQAENNWHEVRAACHQLASETRARVQELTGLAPVCPDSSLYYAQMCAIRLPEGKWEAVRTRLWSEFRIEAPVFAWNEQPLIRVSIQAYNTPEHIDRLVEALKVLLA